MTGRRPVRKRIYFSAGPALLCAALLLSGNALKAQTASGQTAIEPGVVELGFEERVRNEDWNNANDYSDRIDDEREQVRYRTRIWAKVPVRSNILVNVGLTQEVNQKFGKVNQLDEIVFDTANIEIRDVLTKGLSVKIGRQNLIRGEGFLLMDGTSGDGSRTQYLNGVDIGYDFWKSRLDVVGFMDPARDRYLPVWNDKNKAMTEWNESAAGFYYTDQNLKKTRFETYYFYKKETNCILAPSSVQFQPDRHISTAGGRVVQQITPRWTGTAEFARQWGAQHSNRKISGWGGYGYLKRTFDRPRKPYVQAGYWALSGDDPKTSTVEGWDPLFSRWPKWSELYIYSQIKETGVSYWTNVGMWQAEAGFKPTPRMQTRFTYYHMSAFHTFPGSKSYFGTGLGRGNMLQAYAEMKLDDHWTTHALWESMAPGDFYGPQDRGYFIRFQIAYLFKTNVAFTSAARQRATAKK
jgi:hypothetical protein